MGSSLGKGLCYLRGPSLSRSPHASRMCLEWWAPGIQSNPSSYREETQGSEGPVTCLRLHPKWGAGWIFGPRSLIPASGLFPRPAQLSVFPQDGSYPD